MINRSLENHPIANKSRRQLIKNINIEENPSQPVLANAKSKTPVQVGGGVDQNNVVNHVAP